MTISPSSRYARNVVTPITGTDGITRLTLMPLQATAQTYTVVDYVWTMQDRVDILAARVYGDDSMWWLIAGANPEVMDWTSLAAGTIVRVPNGIA